MKKRFSLRTTILLLACFTAPASGNPLLEAQESARPALAELERAREQLNQPPVEPLKEPLFVPPFHKRSTDRTLPATFCRACHRTPSHRDNAVKRAFLNMHERYIGCETCHWKADRPVSYRWLEMAGSPDERGLIVPYHEGQPVTVTETDPRVQHTRKRWEEADLEDRIFIKARLHHPLEEKGPSCTSCHRMKQPRFDLEALGYDPVRARELYLLPIARFVEESKPEQLDEEVKRIRIRDLLQ